VTEENELFLKMLIVPAKMGIVPTKLVLHQNEMVFDKQQGKEPIGT
jgi:hypothetical protein